MRKDNCAKCGKYTFVESHHILPKNMFGEMGDKVDLCPNCHREYHEKLGYKNLKNSDMVFHLLTYYKWLNGLLVLIVAFGIYAAIKYI